MKIYISTTVIAFVLAITASISQAEVCSDAGLSNGCVKKKDISRGAVTTGKIRNGAITTKKSQLML